MKLTARGWTLVGAFGGVLLGSVLTTVNNLVQSRQQHERAISHQNAQHEHERMLAFHASRRDAYTQVLTWFALIRDELQRSIGDGKPWSDGGVVDRYETARIDALTGMYGSEAFRDAAAKWSPGFQNLVRAHDSWLFRFEQTPPGERGGDESLATAHAELQAQMTKLANVFGEVQEVARREAAGLATPPR